MQLLQNTKGKSKRKKNRCIGSYAASRGRFFLISFEQPLHQSVSKWLHVDSMGVSAECVLTTTTISRCAFFFPVEKFCYGSWIGEGCCKLAKEQHCASLISAALSPSVAGFSTQKLWYAWLIKAQNLSRGRPGNDSRESKWRTWCMEDSGRLLENSLKLLRITCTLNFRKLQRNWSTIAWKLVAKFHQLPMMCRMGKVNWGLQPLTMSAGHHWSKLKQILR